MAALWTLRIIRSVAAAEHNSLEILYGKLPQGLRNKRNHEKHFDVSCLTLRADSQSKGSVSNCLQRNVSTCNLVQSTSRSRATAMGQWSRFSERGMECILCSASPCYPPYGQHRIWNVVSSDDRAIIVDCLSDHGCTTPSLTSSNTSLHTASY